eukprot:gnl/TRDRNA2_/TRDRNA2_133566_c0_seq1.p1 gnl/TRDRNA2_/TRDRNA2_133566_c0~~gnl/TRDRNA2_/TRDRNA2_133566_c0_seq1.p1  ORF type:complete len:278 (+),score=54.35 gnl/TRDRNA2_/TRDRNA2_133566_c0_seq1:75-836(+)
MPPAMKKSKAKAAPGKAVKKSIDKWKNIFDKARDNAATSKKAGSFLANLAKKPLKNHQVGCKIYASLPVEIKNDHNLVRELIEYAIERNGMYLRHLPDTKRGQKSLALMAVSQDGLALQYVKGDAKKDKDVVMKAVKTNGSALRHAPKKFRSDLEVIEAAVTARRCTSDGVPFKYVENKAVLSDERLMKLAVKQSGEALAVVDRKFRGNKEIVLTAAKTFYKAMRLATGELQRDKDILDLMASRHYGVRDFYG